MKQNDKKRLNADEESLLVELVGGQGSRGSVLGIKTPSVPSDPVLEDSTVTVAAAGSRRPVTESRESESEGRRKRVSLPPLDELLRDDVIVKRRNAIYVSGDTHRKLQLILSRLTSSRVSVSAFVENMVLMGFELYRDQINARYKEQKEDNLL